MKCTTTLPLLVFLLCSYFSFAQAPSADFSGTPVSVCIGDPVNFTDLSTAGGSPITAWGWDFGDGNSSNQQNTSHTYGAPGTYTVTLVVTAQNGQADAEVKPAYITVHPLPNAGFTTSGNGCTVPFDVTFTNTSDTGPDMTYNWDFGNGQNSTAQNPPAVTYNSAGTYTVVITATNTTTGCSNTFSQDLVVSDYSAGITAPTTGCVGDPISFTDASTVGSNVWNWDFGDGNASTNQNPTHTYGAPGTYTVTLTAQNTGSGCSDVITHDITINPLPTPSFTADVTTGCAPLAVNFTNTSGAGTTFDWDFGNGNTFTGANPPQQQYTADGSYTVSLTMTDANGCTATTTMTNMITVSAPIVQFTMDQYNGCEPLTVQFTDGSVEPDPLGDPLVTWIWDFGDGSPLFSGQNPPPHDYSEGVYSVTLTVITQNGCQASATYTDTIQVGSIANVNFSVTPQTDCAKNPFDFIDLTTFNGTPGQGEVTYSWDFGDGGMSSQQSPTYEYPVDTGYFDVTLTVDWRGCVDSFTMTQAVYVLAPISEFTPDQYLVCNPASFPVSIYFQDNAIHGEQSDDVFMVWKWDDGTPNTTLDDPDLDDLDMGSVTHDFNSYGSFTVEQVIYNYTTGCEDSTLQTVHISETIADFVLSNDSTCVGNPITLTSTSTSSHPFGTYVYDMGDGGTTSGDPATYTYSTSGAFDITLTATNSVGCANTATFTGMDALALPQAAITPSDFAGCAPITVTYNNTSTTVGNGVPIATYDWTFPDQSTQTLSTAASTSYTFNTEGTFTTTLVATDEFGCVSFPATVGMTITKPTASFTLDSVVCDLEVFQTVNGSSGATSYEWFIDGQSTSLTPDLTHSFDEVESPLYNQVTHTIQLIATDQNGCMDTVQQDIIVSMPRADVDFTLTGASVNGQGEFTCPPVFAGFTDNSDAFSTITGWNWDFGNGNSSSLQDPNNTYVFSGTYTASLTITDEYGCTDDTVLVDFLTIGGPQGDPGWVSAGDICGQTYTFEATNLSNVTDIIWNLGDGNTVNDTNAFNHTYQSFDTFSPTATLVDDLGCEVLYDLPLIEIISNGLDAFFVATPGEGPIGTTFYIDEQSTFTGSPIVTWDWDVAGNQFQNLTAADVTQGFGLPGTYPITLLITDANGCTDTYSSFVIITDEFHLPNVITPNGDNTNELFTLPGPIFESFDFVVLNRWGNLIHEIQGGNGTSLWDGKTPQGDDVTDGVYFYKLTGTLVDGSQIEKHGNITVLHGQ